MQLVVNRGKELFGRVYRLARATFIINRNTRWRISTQLLLQRHLALHASLASQRIFEAFIGVNDFFKLFFLCFYLLLLFLSRCLDFNLSLFEDLIDNWGTTLQEMLQVLFSLWFWAAAWCVIRLVFNRIAMVDRALVEVLSGILGTTTLVSEGRRAPTSYHLSLPSLCFACMALFRFCFFQSRWHRVCIIGWLRPLHVDRFLDFILHLNFLLAS